MIRAGCRGPWDNSSAVGKRFQRVEVLDPLCKTDLVLAYYFASQHVGHLSDIADDGQEVGNGDTTGDQRLLQGLQALAPARNAHDAHA